MNPESHERARKLLYEDRVEGISADNRRWLEEHLTGCNACSQEANALAVAVESLRARSVSAPANVVRRTSLAIHRRADQRRVEQEPRVLLWAAAALSSAWTLVTTPYIWALFAWFGRTFQLADMIWQLGFLMWWFLPATVLGAIAGRHFAATRKAASNWAVDNWRSL
jgi:predicted anti-sigma-YlaC factor YlaD